MLSENNVARFIGAHLTDADGAKIGSIGQIYVDPRTGRPNWATVRTGLFGTSESFVPLDEAEDADGDLRVPFTKDVVKGAPRIDSGGELSDDDEDRLYEYYERSGDRDAGDDEHAETLDEGEPDATDRRSSGEPQTGIAAGRAETSRVRLRKYLVTEEQTISVPVTREEVRLEREPVADPAQAAERTDRE
jgi:hypothetical protein